MNKLYDILNSIKPGIDFKKETNLIDDGILTSFDIVSLVATLNDSYDIDITVKDIIPDNFKSAETIMNMVNRLED